MNAAQLFGGAPVGKTPTVNTEQSPAPVSPKKDSHQAAGDEDELQEVPLTPGDGTRKYTSNNNNSTAAAVPTSLATAIGMPPPPFSKK